MSEGQAESAEIEQELSAFCWCQPISLVDLDLNAMNSRDRANPSYSYGILLRNVNRRGVDDSRD